MVMTAHLHESEQEREIAIEDIKRIFAQCGNNIDHATIDSGAGYVSSATIRVDYRNRYVETRVTRTTIRRAKLGY